jgi:xanthine dehydrogenase accessory factor
VTPATLFALNAALAARRPVAFATRLTDGLSFILPDAAAPAALNDAGAATLAADKSATHTIGADPWFIEARNPPPRLAIVGAVHIAQSLAPIAAMAGFDVTIIDPRAAFATPDRFPATTLSHDWPDTALNALHLDTATAVVALSHDSKLDDPALDRALHSPAFYIGALGSRKTHAARLDRLRALGHTDPTLARIHGPIGLKIGALTAPEIAVSIIAELIALRRLKR